MAAFVLHMDTQHQYVVELNQIDCTLSYASATFASCSKSTHLTLVLRRRCSFSRCSFSRFLLRNDGLLGVSLCFASSSHCISVVLASFAGICIVDEARMLALAVLSRLFRIGNPLILDRLLSGPTVRIITTRKMAAASSRLSIQVPAQGLPSTL